MRDGALKKPLPAEMRPQLSDELDEALFLFNVMGGLDFSAVPIMFEVYNVKDPERMIERLAMIRDSMNESRLDGA